MKMVASEEVFGIIRNVVAESTYDCSHFTVVPSIDDVLCKDGRHMFSLQYDIKIKDKPFTIDDVNRLSNACDRIEASVERIWSNRTYWTSRNDCDDRR